VIPENDSHFAENTGLSVVLNEGLAGDKN